MRTFRVLSVAFFIASAIFCFSACGTSKNGAAQVANSNPASGPAPMQAQPSVQALTIPEGAEIRGGGGAATAYATGKQNVALPTETRLYFFLQDPVTIDRAG